MSSAFIPATHAVAASVAGARSTEELLQVVDEIGRRFGAPAAVAAAPGGARVGQTRYGSETVTTGSSRTEGRSMSIALPFPPLSEQSTTPLERVPGPTGAQRSNVASQRVGDLLAQAQGAYTRELEAAGLSPKVVALLQDFVDMTADARLLKREVELKEAELAAPQPSKRPAPALGDRDPLAPLTAAEVAHALNLHENSVRDRERKGKLFSILRSGRKRGQEYPAFQTWEGVVGKPLEDTLAALIPAGQSTPVSGTAAYGFFTSPTDLLADLAPLEVLLGRQLAQRAVDPHASVLLADTPDNRLEMVLETARTFASSDNL